jgi:type IV pilus assembly protein PilA
MLSQSNSRGHSPCSRAQGARRWARGFTLIELLAVVAMIGILAALALVGYRRYLHASHTGEAKEIIGQIEVAEASYKGETLGYLSCSSSLTDWYPRAPTGKKSNWHNPSSGDAPCWTMLNVAVDSPTVFGFAVVAGPPGGTPPQPSTAQTPTWPNPTTEPWYVIQAAGDQDNNGVYSYFVASSFQPADIYVENESD